MGHTFLKPAPRDSEQREVSSAELLSWTDRQVVAPFYRARKGSYQSQQQEPCQEQGTVCTGSWQKCPHIWMSAPSSSWAMAQRLMRRTGRGKRPA